MRIREQVPLAPLTTLGVGGEARRLVDADRTQWLIEAVSEADALGESVFILGGGSNVVIADTGWSGLAIRVATRGMTVEREGDRVRLAVEAGEPWDDLVARCVDEGWSGVECLSGIPGLSGSTPIQNVGAYGQEVKDTIASVQVFDRRSRATLEVPGSDCAFSYRSSLFKGDPRFVVTRVTFVLDTRGESAEIRYNELARALRIAPGARAPLGEVRRTVIALRRTKGMVLDPADPDSKSAGSFFVNPVLDAPQTEALLVRARTRGIDPASVPRFAADAGGTKVSAGWLIENAGFPRGWGLRPGARAGISRKHALALVNRGGATCNDVLEVAAAVRDGVRDAFGVDLVQEPVLVPASGATEDRSR